MTIKPCILTNQVYVSPINPKKQQQQKKNKINTIIRRNRVMLLMSLRRANSKNIIKGMVFRE